MNTKPLERLQKQKIQVLLSLNYLDLIEKVLGEADGAGWAAGRTGSVRHDLESLLSRVEVARLAEAKRVVHVSLKRANKRIK